MSGTRSRTRCGDATQSVTSTFTFVFFLRAPPDDRATRAERDEANYVDRPRAVRRSAARAYTTARTRERERLPPSVRRLNSLSPGGGGVDTRSSRSARARGAAQVKEILHLSDYLPWEELLQYYENSDETGYLLERSNEGFVQFYHTSSVSVSSDGSLYVLSLRDLNTILAVDRETLAQEWILSSTVQSIHNST